MDAWKYKINFFIVDKDISRVVMNNYFLNLLIIHAKLIYKKLIFKVPLTSKFFIVLFGRTFKMIK